MNVDDVLFQVEGVGEGLPAVVAQPRLHAPPLVPRMLMLIVIFTLLLWLLLLLQLLLLAAVHRVVVRALVRFGIEFLVEMFLIFSRSGLSGSRRFPGFGMTSN